MKRAPRVSSRIGAVLFATVVTVLAVSLLVMRIVGGSSAAELRTAAVGPGLAMARSLVVHGDLNPTRLRNQLGDLPGFSLAWYGADGARLGQSHAEFDLVLQRLSADDRQRADTAKGQPVFLELTKLDSPTMAILATDPASSHGIAYVGLFESELRGRLERFRLRVMLPLLATALVLALLASRWLAGRLHTRIVETRDVVRRIADGDLAGRLPAHQADDDELGALTSDFNRMAERLQRLVEDLRSHDTRRRETFAGFAHEVNTPLANASAYLEALNSRHAQTLTPDARRYVQVAFAQVQALAALCHDLETLAALEYDGVRLDCGPANLRDIAVAEVEAQRLLAEGQGVAVVVEGEPITAWVDRGRTAQILRSLLDNAVRHTPAGRRVQVLLRQQGDWAELEVCDEGDGIAPELLPQLGQPLFRVDASRNRDTGGRGLGLAIAFGLVQAQGGHHSVASQPGAGTAVKLRLPLGATAT